MRAFAESTGKAHQITADLCRLFNISLTLVGIKVNPFPVFTAAHGIVCSDVGIFSPTCLIKTVFPIAHKPGFQCCTDCCTAPRPKRIELSLHQQCILKKRSCRAGHGGRGGFALTEIRLVALHCFPVLFSAPCRLSAQSRAVAQPLQVLAGLSAVTKELGDQHPGHMIIELVACVVIRVVAVGDRMVGIPGKALCNGQFIGLAIIGLCVGDSMALRVGRAGLPELGDVVQQIGVGLDVGTVDKPVIIYTMCQSVFQFLTDKFGAVGQHGNMTGRLQIVERSMVIQAMRAGVALRQSGHTGVAVSLAAAHHFAIAVVCPNLDDIFGQVKASLLVKLHGLAVEVGAADGVRVVLLDQIILLPDEGRDECPTLFRGVVLRIVLPEGFIALSPEADVPDGRCGFLGVDGILPEGTEFFRVQAELGFQLRVGLHEHLCPQRLGMVMGDDKAHVGGEVVVAVAVFTRAGNHQIAAQTQQGLKHHDKGHLAAAFHFPMRDERFIVDEPAAIPHPRGFALVGEVLRHGHAVRFGELLVIPEPERLHAQKVFADFKQAIHKAKWVGGGEQKLIAVCLQTETLRLQVTVLDKTDIITGCFSFGEYRIHIALNGGNRILNRFCWVRDKNLAVAIENHTEYPSFEKGTVRAAQCLDKV